MTEQFILAPGEVFKQCPYNVSHLITNEKMITHLEKCRRAYLKALSAEGQKNTMRICRHNAMHHYPAPEIQFHEENCRDAFSVIRHLAFHNSEEGDRLYKERQLLDARLANCNWEWEPEEASSTPMSSSYSHVPNDQGRGRRRGRDEERVKHWEGGKYRDGYEESGKYSKGSRGIDQYKGRDYQYQPKDTGRPQGKETWNRDQYRDRRPSTVDDLEPENRPVLCPNQWGLEEEDWEGESSNRTPGYNPQQKLQEEVVIYNPPGLSKSERKRFRHEYSDKATELELNGEPVEFPVPGRLQPDPNAKPNMTKLTLAEKVKKEPVEREPGELSTDDEDEEVDEVQVKPDSPQLAGTQGFCGTNYQRPGPSEYAGKASYSSYNYPKLNTSYAAAHKGAFPFGMWYGDQDSDTDSDDYEGVDPYY